MASSMRSMHPSFKILALCSMICWASTNANTSSARRSPDKSIATSLMTRRTVPAPTRITGLSSIDLNRRKRQLLFPRLPPLRSRLTGMIRPRLPPRQPIILPMVTSAVSDRIRTYPYYLQEIPLAVGETIMESVREAAPHFTEAFKEISPGIMEIVNIIPDAKDITPIQRMMKKIPIILHETVQVAMDPIEDLGDTETRLEHRRRGSQPAATRRAASGRTQTENLESKQPQTPTIEQESTRSRPSQMLLSPLEKLEETSMNLKSRINTRIQETRQNIQNLFEVDNSIDSYEDDPYPNIKSAILQSPYSPRKIMEKASSVSHNISPVINESLKEVAHIPQKIKTFVQQMKQ
ncbi:hypothetical protein JYU34_006472 [Plutella xylostella]|uniref:Uncharacterized protein n=1 Tax=Plutella xylostella TaxID=51655 RepID=A0ABQ7QS60_PLUXY|nr:hypothetical protein JYU34_006472 [Plutella xylostella]